MLSSTRSCRGRLVEAAAAAAAGEPRKYTRLVVDSRACSFHSSQEVRIKGYGAAAKIVHRSGNKTFFYGDIFIGREVRFMA